MSTPLTSFAKRLMAAFAGRVQLKRPSTRFAFGLRKRRSSSVSESIPSTDAFAESSSRISSCPSASEREIGVSAAEAPAVMRNAAMNGVNRMALGRQRAAEGNYPYANDFRREAHRRARARRLGVRGAEEREGGGGGHRRHRRRRGRADGAIPPPRRRARDRLGGGAD